MSRCTSVVDVFSIVNRLIVQIFDNDKHDILFAGRTFFLFFFLNANRKCLLDIRAPTHYVLHFPVYATVRVDLLMRTSVVYYRTHETDVFSSTRTRLYVVF